MNMCEILHSILILAGILFGGFLGTIIVKNYTLRVKYYRKYIEAFAKCVNISILVNCSSQEINKLKIFYFKQELFIKLYGSDRIINLINKLRKKCGIKDNQIVWRDIANNQLEWISIDLSDFFNMNNYDELCKIARDDMKSWKFKFGIL